MFCGDGGVRVHVVAPDVGEVGAVDLVIDGAYGTGMNRSYQAPMVPAGTPVLAVDIPSGLNGLTGETQGTPLAATHTLTFAALKPGLLVGDGPELAGSIEVVDIGLDTSTASSWQIASTDVARRLPVRPRDSHKWQNAVYVIGGSQGMYGAPLLASQAALRTGAGMVWCGLPGQTAPPLASEIVFTDVAEGTWHEQVLAQAGRFGAFVVGPGMAPDACGVGELVTASERPVVVDGGGIRSLGLRPELGAHVVLTPHDGEFQALMGERPNADRFAAARAAAACTGATVLLKGSVTIVATPDGRCIASVAGDQRLATAGTGDVLAGIIGSFLAAGLEPVWAAAMGAWLHGEAGRTQRRHGFVASDLLAGIAVCIEDLQALSW